MRYAAHKLQRIRAAFLIFFLSVLATTMVSINIFEHLVRPIIHSLAETRGKSLAVSIINNSVNTIMQGTQYSDLMQFQLNNNGEVVALTANVVKMNQLKAQISSHIQDAFNDVELMKIGLPLGNLTGQDFLSGWGPRIYVKLVPLGYASLDVENGFEAAGINQTKHEIFLKVDASVSVLLPVTSVQSQISTRVPIAQTIIVGNVPDTYTNIEGADGSAADIALNVLQ